MDEIRMPKELLLTWLSLLPTRGRQIKEVLCHDLERLERLWKRIPEETQILKTASGKFYEAIMDWDIRDNAQRAYGIAKRKGFGVMSIAEDRYPSLLKEVPDAPVVLFFQGNPEVCKQCISLVGSRKATVYGLRVAENLAMDLARKGICVVSGMARGIDSKAHLGALNANGTTCAVIGSGLDVVYPPENQGLMERIAENGVVLTEYAPGTMPLPQHFPARNRIISGLSQGLVVVEAGKRSGTLITVDFALEQGRDVFSVPGNIYSERSAGTNRLIQEGAKLVTEAADILQEYSWIEAEKEPHSLFESQKPEAGLRNILLEYIKTGMFQIEEVVQKTDYTIQEINTELMLMQLEGVVEKEITGEYFIKERRK